MDICKSCPHENNPIGHCYKIYKEIRTIDGEEVVNTYYRLPVYKIGKITAKSGKEIYSFDSEYECKRIKIFMPLYLAFSYKKEDITPPEELNNIASSPSPAEELIKRERDKKEIKKVERIIAKARLTPRELDAFETCLKGAELGRILGITRQAVWNSKQKAIKKLKKVVREG